MKGILTNLLQNAAEAAGPHGVVLVDHVVGARRSRHRSARFGPGIDARAAATLFEPTITFKKHGMGLGLSIAKKNALLSDGDIALVQGELGGAAFRVTLRGCRGVRTAERHHDEPQAPHRDRRRRAEHRPVAAPDSGGRGLPRHRLRVGGDVSGGARQGPRPICTCSMSACPTATASTCCAR